MAQINTRIILRNDTLAKWEANPTVVLMKGEAGLAFDTDGTVKVKFGDGVTTWENLDWFGGEIDTTAVENIQDAVDDLSAALGSQADEDAGAAATGIYAEIDRIDDELANRYTKSETEAAIAAAMAGVDHLSYTKVDSYDAIDPAAENAHRYIYLVPNAEGEGNAYDEYMVIDGTIEHVGNLSVDLSGYVEKVAGSRLMTEAEGDKLANLLNIKSHTSEFALSDEGELSLSAVEMAKVTGLTEALGDKVDKADGQRMITEEEANKLANLVLNEDGSVGLSGKVSVENVDGLADLLNNYANVIEKVQVGGVDLTVNEDKVVNIPVATADALGVVKSSTNENEITVAADGTMSVMALSVDRLVQNESSYLILNGGSAQ